MHLGYSAVGMEGILSLMFHLAEGDTVVESVCGIVMRPMHTRQYGISGDNRDPATRDTAIAVTDVDEAR